VHPKKGQKTYKSSFSNQLCKPDTCTFASSPTTLSLLDCSSAKAYPFHRVTYNRMLHTVTYERITMYVSIGAYRIGLYPKVRMCPIVTYVHVCTNRRYVCFPSICNCLEKKIVGQYEFTNILDSYRRIGGHDQKIRVLCALSDTLVRKVQTYCRFQFFSLGNLCGRTGT
jgi:hypothetical protein